MKPSQQRQTRWFPAAFINMLSKVQKIFTSRYDRVMQSHCAKGSRFRQLISDHKVQCAEILSAAGRAEEVRSTVKEILTENFGSLSNKDASFVVFGSLARDEWTSGSDLDWTLVIDGQADPEHAVIARKIALSLKERFNAPGATGIFGTLSFSHDLVHRIGGQHDTNQNTTQRILLLLEADAIGLGVGALGPEGAAFGRVLEAVLLRYLETDPSSGKLPRFLLNDIVRFWRTIAVDFANKQRERSGAGWGLRNAKLRLSRKLIFAAGMLICFGFAKTTAELKPAEKDRPPVDILRGLVGRTPLEVLASACLDAQLNLAAVNNIFESYNAFLGILGDQSKREELNDLRSEGAQKSALFQEIRTISRDFQSGLTTLFFETDSFRNLTRKYGVF